MPFFSRGASVRGANLLWCGALLTAGLMTAEGQLVSAGSDCTDLLQAQDSRAVGACKAQLDEAEKAPVTEHMARIIADDNYGVALLAIAHQAKQSPEPFDRAIALLPQSTVKADSVQWAVAYWHRATAYQQLRLWERAAADLKIAEDTLTRGIVAATRDRSLAEHFTQLRQRVVKQRADVLAHAGGRGGI